MNTVRSMRIMFIDLHQDDPRKATMHKLERFGLAVRIPPGAVGDGLVLMPESELVLTRKDRWVGFRHGLVVIEGSWKRKKSTKKFSYRNNRRLPLLLASNPVNYGKIGMLSSVEALSSALFIMGMEESAKEILSKFSWGHTFLEANLEPLNEYAGCEDAESVERIESEFFPTG